MLVLLIIFMVTAPLLASAVPVNLPDSRAKPIDTEEQDPIQLSIKGDDTLYIGEEEVRETELPARLEAIAAADANSENPRQIMLRRSEERRGVKECVSTGRSRWASYHSKTKNSKKNNIITIKT